MRNIAWMTAGIVVIIVLSLALLPVNSTPTTAAPAMVVTPVAGIVSHGTTPKTVKTFIPTTAITTTTNGAAQRIIDYDVVDLQLIVDQTAVNTITLKMQLSNNGTSWVDGVTLASENVADAETLTQYALFGAYARIVATVTTTDPVTVTVLGAVK